ncbi:hypothetical protein PR048_003115 [Dryococelus australis]|uniref:Uncharacterized protein n=1 Tax=Dryococelus australis TaxID=614101 RepID=A0ABQ9IM39_9NEOP|nr:hypothetical protein PR048_003115 [Dryococelus australis]
MAFENVNRELAEIPSLFGTSSVKILVRHSASCLVLQILYLLLAKFVPLTTYFMSLEEATACLNENHLSPISTYAYN